jgi:hypothetical protein
VGDPVRRSRELAFVYFLTFENLIPPFPALPLPGKAESCSQRLLSVQTSPERRSIRISCSSSISPLLEWLAAGDYRRQAIFRLRARCGLVRVPLQFIAPVIPLTSSDSDAILVVATLLPAAELSSLREKLIDAALPLFEGSFTSVLSSVRR